MSTLAREVLLLGVAAVVSWWLLLSPHAPDVAEARAQGESPERALSLALLPRQEARTEPAASPEPAPPPPELGTPEGEEEAAPAAPEPDESEPEESEAEPEPADAEPEESEPVEDAEPTPEELMSDPELLATAERELTGQASRGFATVLVASPEEQLAIAEHYGEEVVLVPRRALDPEAEQPVWYRLSNEDPPRVERVEGKPPLASHRQYRDLFEYEYGRLPAPLRELRRSVLSRDEIYLFAALIPSREWALFVARRREALEQAGREEDEVRRFVLRYRSGDGGAYDLSVEEIVFADGERFRPGEEGRTH